MKETTNKGVRLIKVLLMALLVLAALMFLNPSTIPLLTEAQKASLQNFVDLNFSQLPSSFVSLNLNLGMVLSTLLMAGLLYVIYSIISLIVGMIHFRTPRKKTLSRVLMNVLKYALSFLGIVWGLMIFGVDTAAIFAGVGIVTLVVTLGAESLFADIFVGIFILLEDQYHEGDIISIDGFRGEVVSLGIRTTRIEDAGGNVKIINNADIRNVMNLSNKISYSICDISISYGESIERAEAVIAQMLHIFPEKYPEVFQEVPIYAGVQSLSASSVDLRIMAKVDESVIYTGRRILNRELKLAFDAAGIEIPFPQLVVHKAES